jgi:hypothetical protein
MREIAEAAWRCADPGVQYDTTINQWHTCPTLAGSTVQLSIHAVLVANRGFGRFLTGQEAPARFSAAVDTATGPRYPEQSAPL